MYNFPSKFLILGLIAGNERVGNIVNTDLKDTHHKGVSKKSMEVGSRKMLHLLNISPQSFGLLRPTSNFLLNLLTKP